MQLFPGDWRYFEDWRREMERDMEPFTGSMNPPRVNLYEIGNEVVASCYLPGIEKKEDIEIHVDLGILTIQGEIRRHHDNDPLMPMGERLYGRFKRSVSLPTDIRAEGVRASYRNGILEIRLPKADPAPGSKIDIEFH